jgi:hypothetical protein
MNKQVICRVIDDKGFKFLAYHEPGEPITDFKVDPDDNFTLEELADLCDEQAEQRNAHEFVGSHRLMAALLHRKTGRDKATDIMRQIAEMGGLNGMNGIGGRGAFKEFGIAEPWKKWSLPA